MDLVAGDAELGEVGVGFVPGLEMSFTVRLICKARARSSRCLASKADHSVADTFVIVPPTSKTARPPNQFRLPLQYRPLLDSQRRASSFGSSCRRPGMYTQLLRFELRICPLLSA